MEFKTNEVQYIVRICIKISLDNFWSLNDSCIRYIHLTKLLSVDPDK